VTNPIALPSFILCKTFISSSTLSNMSSFLTWSVQLICIFYQFHISKDPQIVTETQKISCQSVGLYTKFCFCNK
jgi:hypothetical protein